MLRNLYKFLCLIMVMTACNSNTSEIDKNVPDSTTDSVYGRSSFPLTGYDFKVPVPQGYDWEITQSWEKHCDYCNSKGYDKIDNGYYGNYCHLSHATNDPADYGCFDFCKFGWDFNLTGTDDFGKSVLASGDGVVVAAKVGKDSNGKYKGGGWGNTVIIDHGNNICSRYAHMKDGSVTVVDGQQVCQGLKIGEVGDTPSVGAHLHFQFEGCDDHKPIEMGFTDGNGVPMCVIGNDRYTNGVYTALKLTNVEKSYCTEEDLYQKDPNPPDDSSEPQVCDLTCPMNQQCDNPEEIPFTDIYDSEVKEAVSYLWRECVFTDKNNFFPFVDPTRAEALKIAIALFGLDKNCEGTLESFVDVNPGQWFYPFVVCGVKYGIIDSQKSNFNPGDPIIFAEAAKIMVEAGVKAGKIKLKTGTYINFPLVTKEHWAYPYLQTIAYYNGIDENLKKRNPTDPITRGDYSRMIAALSPCYCYKNKCKSGCACNQESHLCEGNSGTTGKDGQVGSWKNEPDVQSFSVSKDAGSNGANTSDTGAGNSGCVPYCYKRVCGTDGCGGTCGTCPSNMFCMNDYGQCQYICQSQSCEELGCECGKCPMTNPGCSGSKLCGDCTAGNICKDNKCVKPSCTPKCENKNCGSDGCGGSCGTCSNFSYCKNDAKCTSCYIDSCQKLGYECGDQLFMDPGCEPANVACGFCDNGKQCVNHKCVFPPPPEGCKNCPTGWCVDNKCILPDYKCDPKVGYSIYFSAKSGKFESLTSPNQKYYSGDFQGSMGLHYDCSELPASLMMTNFSSKITIWLKDKDLAPFAVWWPYTGPQVFPGPAIKSDLILQQGTFDGGKSLLIKIPYN